MLPVKRKLPVLRRKKNDDGEEKEKEKEDEHKSKEGTYNREGINDANENAIYRENKIIYENNNENNINSIFNPDNRKFSSNLNNNALPRVSENVEIPEFLLRPENDHYFQSYMRMRQRNITDGAIIINLENDDIANNRVDLYDSKAINVSSPSLNENSASNIDYFIENMNRDKFVKIPKQTVMKMIRLEKSEKDKQKLKEIVTSKKEEKIIPQLDANVDFHRITEDEMFEIFDRKLTEVINKTANRISLLFFFIQGLLAGEHNLNLKFNLNEIII